MGARNVHHIAGCYRMLEEKGNEHTPLTYWAGSSIMKPTTSRVPRSAAPNRAEVAEG